LYINICTGPGENDVVLTLSLRADNKGELIECLTIARSHD